MLTETLGKAVTEEELKRVEEIEKAVDPYIEFLIRALESLDGLFKARERSDFDIALGNKEEEDSLGELKDLMEKSEDLFGLRE